MAGIDDVYTSELHKELNIRAAWTPDTNYSLGDFGEIVGKILKRIGNIAADFNTPIRAVVSDGDSPDGCILTPRPAVAVVGFSTICRVK